MNDRAIAQKAAEIARESGREMPIASDIKAARRQENAKRRESGKANPVTPPVAPSSSLEDSPERRAGAMLAGWYGPGSQSHRLGLRHALTALSANGLLAYEMENVLVSIMESGRDRIVAKIMLPLERKQ